MVSHASAHGGTCRWQSAICLVLCAVLLLFSLSAQAQDANPGLGDLKGHGGPVKALALSADGKTMLSGSFDYSMMSWNVGDAAKPELLQRFTDHDGAVNAVLALNGGKLAVTGSDDGMARLIDLETGKVLHVFKGHEHKIVGLGISGDGKLLASASWDRTVRIWSLADRREVHVLKGHRNTVNAAVFSADGDHVFSTGTDGTVRKWRMSDGAEDRIIYKHGWGVNVLAALADGKHLAFGALNGKAAVLNIETGDVVHELAQRERPILSIAVSEQHKAIAFGGGDGIVSVHDMTDWTPVKLLDNPYGPIWALSFSADGDALYLGGLDDVIHFWQFRPGRNFEPALGQFPRRFQVAEGISLGERQFARKCSVCHTLSPDDANRAGPTLWDVFGREAGTLPGYAYSKALIDSPIIWNEQTIGDLFEKGPHLVVPGTKMPIQVMADQKERNAMIAWLKEQTTPPDKK